MPATHPGNRLTGHNGGSDVLRVVEDRLAGPRPQRIVGQLNGFVLVGVVERGGATVVAVRACRRVSESGGVVGARAVELRRPGQLAPMHAAQQEGSDVHLACCCIMQAGRLCGISHQPAHSTPTLPSVPTRPPHRTRRLRAVVIHDRNAHQVSVPHCSDQNIRLVGQSGWSERCQEARKSGAQQRHQRPSCCHGRSGAHQSLRPRCWWSQTESPAASGAVAGSGSPGSLQEEQRR